PPTVFASVLFAFFFQAEDGIRDKLVTGVQTCALPISPTAYMCRAPKNREAYEALGAATEQIESEQTKRVPEKLKNKHFPVNPQRSEERRVGKECRSRRSQDD